MEKEKSEKSLISARFEYIKLHFDLNNSELAAIAGLTHTAIKDILDGKSDNPKINTIGKICKHLHINYDWFFEEDAELHDGKKDESKVSFKNPMPIEFLMQELERYRKREDIWINSQLGKCREVLNKPFGFSSFFLVTKNQSSARMLCHETV